MPEDGNDINKIKVKYQINKKINMKKIKEKHYYKKNNRCIQFKDLVISYVELENNLKALEEKLKTGDTEIN